LSSSLVELSTENTWRKLRPARPVADNNRSKHKMPKDKSRRATDPKKVVEHAQRSVTSASELVEVLTALPKDIRVVTDVGAAMYSGLGEPTIPDAEDTDTVSREDRLHAGRATWESTMTLLDAAAVLDDLANGREPSRTRAITGALALQRLNLNEQSDRDLLDAEAGLKVIAAGGELGLDSIGRERSSDLERAVRLAATNAIRSTFK
jgi:hypothetical protein